MNWLAILRAIAPKGKDAILRAVAQAMPGIAAEFAINTPLRQAHFLAQIAHESDGFRTTVEYASGKAYEGRKDLGNNAPGDGVRYKGRGLIQLTGKSNYQRAGVDLGLNLVGSPEIAAQFPAAIRTAGWYWQKRRINAKADEDNLFSVSAAVNGINRTTGEPNGLAGRGVYLERAKEALASLDSVDPPKPKTMTTSKTGAASIVVAAAGTAATVKETVEQVNNVRDAASSAVDLSKNLLSSPYISLICLGIVLAGCAFIWYDRRQKLKTYGI